MTPADAFVLGAIQLLTQAAALGCERARDALAALADPDDDVVATVVRSAAKTPAQRSKAYRERQRAERDAVTQPVTNVTSRHVTRDVTKRDAESPSQTLPLLSLSSEDANKTGDSDQEKSSTREPNAVTRHVTNGANVTADGVTRDAKRELRAAARRDDVSAVYGHWLDVMSKDPKRWKLNSPRRLKIEARLREGYSVGDLKAAIDGCRRSEYHMGANQNAQEYNDLVTIMKNGPAVDSHIARAVGNGRRSVESSPLHLQDLPPVPGLGGERGQA